jgi:tetratricopeptide (TPR) repeat protein
MLKKLISIILLISALIISAWSYGIHDIEKLNSYLLYLIQFIILIFILFIIFVFALWVATIIKSEYAIVIPFYNATGNSNYDGKGISDSLIAEFQNIRKIYSYHFEEQESQRLPLTGVKLKVDSEEPSKLFGNLQTESEDLANNLSNMGTINLGVFTLAIGSLILFAKRYLPRNKKKFIVCGSLQKYGSNFRLVAQINYGGEITTREINRKIKTDNDIPELIKDLSFIISHQFSGGLSGAKARSWETFRYFTEALDYYYNFSILKNDADLKKAEIHCIKATRYDPNYYPPFALFYNLGLAYFNKEEYYKAYRMFKFATDIVEVSENYIVTQNIERKYHSAAYSGLSASLRYLHRYIESVEAAKNAIGLDAELPASYSTIGYVYFDLSAYVSGLSNKAFEAFNNAAELDPDFANPSLGIGLIMYRKREYENALKKFQKASELASKPGYKLGWDELAAQIEIAGCYLRLKETDKKYKDKYDNLINEIGREKESLSIYNRACFESISGDAKKACEFLQIALDRKDIFPSEVKYEPDFEPIHQSEQFKKLMANPLYAEDQETIDNIRKFLLSENIYSRSSFEAVSGNYEEAIRLLEAALKSNIVEATEVVSDPHFELALERVDFKKLIKKYSE